MTLQIAYGTFLILLSTLVAGFGFLLLEWALIAGNTWLRRPPHAIKIVFLLVAAVFWTLGIVTASVWIWAFGFLALNLFGSIEASVYFAIVAFTTLGFGDVLLPPEWRLLSGMAAVNGLLLFGLLTAMLVEVVRRTRSLQSDRTPWSG